MKVGCFFCSFNKPMSFASLFAAISSFFDRFRMSEDSCPQSRSSLPSKHSKIPLHTNDLSMQVSGSDLQLNWSSRHRDNTGKWLIGYWGAAHFFGSINCIRCACLRMCACAYVCACMHVVFSVDFFLNFSNWMLLIWYMRIGRKSMSVDGTV